MSRKPFEPIFGTGVERDAEKKAHRSVVWLDEANAAIAQDEKCSLEVTEKLFTALNKAANERDQLRAENEKLRAKQKDVDLWMAEKIGLNLELQKQLAETVGVLKNLHEAVHSDVTLSESTVRFYATVGSAAYNKARDFLKRHGGEK